MPSINHCFIIGNSATYGGGLYCVESWPAITKCTITTNSAEYGGGIYCAYSSLLDITNCVISTNGAVINGGGMYCYDSVLTIANCTFSANMANIYGGAAYLNDLISSDITNSIFWDDSPDEIYSLNSDFEITYCNIQGGDNENNNYAVPPLFVSPDDGNYRLQQGSPCIDTGCVTGLADDRDGSLRPQDGSGDDLALYDIGAYEFPELAALCPGLYLVGFPLELKNICHTTSCLWEWLIDKDAMLLKMQTYMTGQASWLTLVPGSVLDEENFSLIFDKAWLVYVTDDESSMLDPNFFEGQEIDSSLFSGVNLLPFHSLSKIINGSIKILSWPKNMFQIFTEQTEYESTCMTRYDHNSGKWKIKYQFFNQTAGPEPQIEEEGYIVSVK